jgi:hypothetical protein
MQVANEKSQSSLSKLVRQVCFVRLVFGIVGFARHLFDSDKRVGSPEYVKYQQAGGDGHSL